MKQSLPREEESQKERHTRAKLTYEKALSDLEFARKKKHLAKQAADVTFENGVDVLARVSARFEGFTGHWVNSMRLNAQQFMVFLGESGSIRVTTPFNAGVFGEAQVEVWQGTDVRVERFPAVNQYVLQVEAFGRSIRAAEPFAWTLEDARGTQAVLDACFAAAG